MSLLGMSETMDFLLGGAMVLLILFGPCIWGE